MSFTSDDINYDPKIYLGNCLYSASTASQEFEEIAKFLTKNPTEIVIIDLNGDWLHTFDSDNNPDFDFYLKLDQLLDYWFLSHLFFF